MVYFFKSKGVSMKIIIVALLFIASVWAGVSINHASKQELISVKGIGEKSADAIIAYRTLHPFKSVSELTEVKGFGEKKLKKIEKDLEL